MNTSANPFSVEVRVLPDNDPVEGALPSLKTNVIALPFEVQVPASAEDAVVACPFLVVRDVNASVKLPPTLTVRVPEINSTLSWPVWATTYGRLEPLTVFKVYDPTGDAATPVEESPPQDAAAASMMNRRLVRTRRDAAIALPWMLSVVWRMSL